MVRGQLVPNRSKSDHLLDANTSKPVTYSLTSRTSTNSQPIQAVSTAYYLGPLLNSGSGVDDNVARAPKKA